LALLLALAVSGCRLKTATVKPTALPSGVYTNVQYHFSVRYPTGWNPNVTATGSAVAPLQVTITRSSDLSGNGSVVSTLTIGVFNAADATIAKTITNLSKQAGVQKITLADKQAYKSPSATQQLPGSSVTVTHTEYDLITGGYEYQLSTDTVQGDGAEAALSGMLDSFQITP
jgi:hypothetical protein